MFCVFISDTLSAVLVLLLLEDDVDSCSGEKHWLFP
jgi:hypothetical protein